MDDTTSKIESKDSSEFADSLRQLRCNLLNDYVYDDKSIVIALSRKGPKVLELAFKEEELQNLNIVTEFAVPFLMKSLQSEEEYRIYIVDDAIYFGSTLKNLIAEIREYEKWYHLNLKIRAYVALQDKDALQFSDVEVKGMTGSRSGYGHYFVRQIMSKFRSLHRCMEVEFPVVTYEFTADIDLRRIASLLTNVLPAVYVTKYREGQVVTALLAEEGCQFSKIRFYGEGKRLHIAFMAPRIIPGGLENLQHLMDNFGSIYRSFWNKLMNHLYGDLHLLQFNMLYNRNRERSVIVLANFIYSYYLFVGLRFQLQQLFSNLGYVYRSFYLQKRSIFKLVGIQSIEEELKKMLFDDMQVVIERRPMNNTIVVAKPSQNYEEEESPTAEERNSLAEHNLHMVRNSMNLLQALSAIVFNQNLFVERWTRIGNEGSRRHLWFGYTHDALGALVKRYAKFEATLTMEKDIHQWLDGRIDLGCVVPQYIRDKGNNAWVRVFRPGENEDVLLSHLSRFVIHIYGQIEKHIHLGYCPKEVLDKVLAIVWRQYYEDLLNRQFDFRLKVEDGDLYLDQVNLPTRLTVIRYLQKMYIFNINNDEEITVSPRIADPDFLHHTTLDKKIERTIDEFIQKMFEQMKEWDVDLYSSYSYFNHYLNRDVETRDLVNTVQKSALELKSVLEKIEVGLTIHSENPLSNDIQQKVLDVYHQIRKYDEHPNFYISNGLTEEEYWQQYRTMPRVKVQHNFKVMYQLINLIVGVYILHSEDIITYLKSDVAKTAMSILRMGSLKTYLEKVEKEKGYKDLRYGTTMLGLMKGILDRIIKS